MKQRHFPDKGLRRIKQFFEVPFARHNDGLPPKYYAALAEFLDQVDGVHAPASVPQPQRQLVS